MIVEVLLNDVDPERDGLRLDSFSAEPEIGTVTETEGPSGLPALEYTPTEGLEGEATFSYRPADTFGAVGEPVDVVVTVARPGDANRPPVVQPDSVRTRRNSEAIVPRPGQRLGSRRRHAHPLGRDAASGRPRCRGSGRPAGRDPPAGKRRSGHVSSTRSTTAKVTRSAVRCSSTSSTRTNRIARRSFRPTLETVVVGQTILIDVTANDSDPDNDPLAIVDVSQPTSGGAVRNAGRNQIEFTPTAIDEDKESNVRFTYTVSDGNGHEVVGEVTVTVLAEALPEPPFARDDSTFTFVDDQAVTIDVLRNDGDPSGEGPPGPHRHDRAARRVAVATVSADDGQVRYNPPPGRSGVPSGAATRSSTRAGSARPRPTS